MHLQQLYGSNWLMKKAAEDIELAASNIGSSDSTFQGCRDMRKVASCMECQCSLDFYATITRFTLSLPGTCVQPPDTAASDFSDVSRVHICCADDQNAPRLQVMNAAESMGIPLHEKRT